MFFSDYQIKILDYVYHHNDDSLVDSSRFSLTIDGYSFVEYRHREFWKFVVPYAITTFIAFTGLAVSAVSLYCQFFR